MELKRITNKDSKEFEKSFTIYQCNFPLNEIRSKLGQIKALTNSEFHYDTIVDNENVVGILLNWQTDDFVYIEHFAIDDLYKGKGYGTKAIEILKSKSLKPIILEIETPIDDTTIRRKHFYEKLGFRINSFPHFPPSYVKNQPPLDLKIMSIPKIDSDLYNKFNEYLKNTVMFYS